MKKLITALLRKLNSIGELIVHTSLTLVAFLCIYLINEVGGTIVIVCSLLILCYCLYVAILMECVRSTLIKEGAYGDVNED